MKNIFLLILLLSASITLYSQKTEYFKPIFNEHDLSGWNMPGKVPGFIVENGIMIARPHDTSDIFTEEFFGNYVLRFEYLLSEVGNSGVLIRSDPQDPWRTGVEVQLLAPWTPYRDDLHCTGSIYGHVAVTNRPDETTGIWHEMEITCDRKMISVSVDGKLTTIANIDTVPGMRNKNLYGAIGFQSNHSKEGEYAQFKNIMVYDLDSDPGYVLAGFYDNDARVRKQSLKAAEKLGLELIPQLTKMLDESNSKAEAGARQVLFNMVAHATGPNATSQERTQIAESLTHAATIILQKDASAYLNWLIDMTKNQNTATN